MKFKTGKVSWGVVLAVLVASAPLFAQNILKVKCVDQDGQVIKDVKVYAMAMVSKKTEDEKSKKDGFATFKKLKNDLYRIWAHHKGYESTYFEFVRLKNEADESITLEFKPGNPEKNLYFEDNAMISQAAQLLEEGVGLLQNRQFAQAEEKIKASLEIYPSNHLALHNLALSYMMAGKFDEAEETFKQELKVLTMFEDTFGNQDPSLGQQLAMAKELVDSLPLTKVAFVIDEAMKAQKFEEALPKLDELISMEPDNVQPYYTKALAQAQLRRFDEAKVTLDQGLAKGPKDPAPFNDLKSRIGEIQKNEAANRARNAVAEVQQLVKEQKFAEALEKLPSAEETAPDDLKPILDNARAQSYLGLKEYARAFEALTVVWEHESKPVDQSLFELGQNLAKTGNQEAARMAYERILEINPEFPEIYYELGMEYFYGTEEKEKAKEFLQKYLEIGKDEAHLSNTKNVLAVIDR